MFTNIKMFTFEEGACISLTRTEPKLILREGVISLMWKTPTEYNSKSDILFLGKRKNTKN